ncbi:uncharacterized protein PV09_06185 [Verruconis gallopava]|uniref:Small ribosomal subunit protein uS7 domain-containing protein n=1 Tax=Verruconis gallopava TaxID=253628 RepID=A0A0D2A6K4_9PEZI|nr:uncharacterized protein PV09_06185 [Verruconis gallopava]KIW02363.1 hypothetical protein PV09_06185 [Verruconis gallopava]
MPPRLNVLHPPRTLVLRPKTSPSSWRVFNGSAHARPFSDSPKDPNVTTDQDIKERTNVDHNMAVSEEAKVMAKVRGEQGPDLQQGTPIEEIVKDDKEAQKNLPKVMQDALKKGNSPSGTRAFSTTAFRRDHTPAAQSRAMSTSVRRNQSPMSMTSSPGPIESAVVESGMSDLTPKEPRARVRHLHNRHQNIVEQFVGLLIRDGKKAAAQRNVALILSHLRTSPPPKLDSPRLLPEHPPAAHLPLNPVLYLQLAVDSVAPILRIKQLKGAAGGGMALPVPVPLSLRRRRWEAIHWIIDAASKRRSRGSGSGMFAQKVAEEIVNVVEGKSSVWAKRDALHKQAVAARANMVPQEKIRR